VFIPQKNLASAITHQIGLDEAVCKGSITRGTLLQVPFNETSIHHTRQVESWNFR
jgi:hypothetical protein